MFDQPTPPSNLPTSPTDGQTPSVAPASSVGRPISGTDEKPFGSVAPASSVGRPISPAGKEPEDIFPAVEPAAGGSRDRWIAVVN